MVKTEDAVELMRRGAHDFVPKGDLARLVPALQREIDEAASRHQRDLAEAALDEREALLQGIMDSSSDPIFFKDLDGRYMLANAVIERLMERPLEDIIGKTDLDLFGPDRGAKNREIDHEILETGEPRTVEYDLTLKDGIHSLMVAKSPFRGADGKAKGIVGVVHDVTDLRASERELERTTKALRTISRVNETLVRAINREQLFNEACRILVDEGGYRLAWITYQKSSVASKLSIEAHYGFNRDFLDLWQSHCRTSGRHDCHTCRAMDSGKTMVSDVLQEDPAWSDLREDVVARDFGSLVSLPLLSKGEAFGALNIITRAPHGFDATTVLLLEELAGDLAYGVMALEETKTRARIEEELRNSLADQNIIAEVLTISLEPGPLHEALEDALTMILDRRELNIQSKGCIFLWEEESQELVMAAQQNLSSYLCKACDRVPVGHCLCGRAASSVDILHTTHLDERHDVTYDGIEDHGHYCAPIKSGGRLLGVLNLYLEAGHDRDEVEIRFIKAFCDTLASIIDRKRAEENLRDREERMRAVVENALDGIISIDRDGHVTEYNPAAEAILGYSRREAIGTPVADLLVPPAMREQHAEGFAKFVATGRGKLIGKPVEVEALRKDGTLCPVELSISAMTGEGSTVATAIMRDITERRKAEETLRKLSHAMEQSPASIVITDTAGTIEYVNPRFTDMSGYGSTEVIGKNPRILKSGETSAEEYEALWSTITGGKTWRGRLHNRRKDGSLYWVSVSISPITDSAGTVTHFIGIQEDITERLEAEQQLWQSQKVESLGNLAGGIAHDINNMLLPIQALTEMTMKELPEDSRGRGRLAKVVDASVRAKDLVSQILAFSRKEEAKREEIDLTEVVSEAIGLLRSTLPSSMEIRDNLMDPPCTVLADPSQIHAVLMNLGANSADAMEGRTGHLDINLHPAQLDERDYLTTPNLSANRRYVLMRVKDNGCGIDEEVLNRVFDPFFTTKVVGEGTGLGLSVVHGIITKHDGAIRIRSKAGKGTTFEIFLPLSEDGGDAGE